MNKLFHLLLLTLITPGVMAAPLKDHKEYKLTLPAKESKWAVSDDIAAGDQLIASAAFRKVMNDAAQKLTGKTCDAQSFSTMANNQPTLAGFLEIVEQQAEVAKGNGHPYRYARISNGYYTVSSVPGYSTNLGLWVLLNKGGAFLSCQLK